MRTLGIPTAAIRFAVPSGRPGKELRSPMAPQVKTSRRASDERGAALIEFALILPVFMMLILGMFSGGLAYNQKLSMTNAAREASRFGATLPVRNADWAETVASVAADAATGELDSSIPDRYIEVCYSDPATTTHKGWLVNGSGAGAATTSCSVSSSQTHAHVIVRVKRGAQIEWLLGSSSIELVSQSVTRYERP